jgi:hypothetical protein
MVARRRTVIRAVVHRTVVIAVMHRAMVDRTVMYWTVMHRMMHDLSATRLRHRQCRHRQGSYGQRNGNQKLLHGTPLLDGHAASMRGAC